MGTALLAIAAVLVLLLVLFPIAILLINSLKADGSLDGAWSLEHYKALLTDPQYLPLLRTTLVYTFGSALFATVVASVLAWIVSSFELPFGRVLRILPVLPLLIPPLLKDTAWIQLYSHDIGLVNVFFDSVLHLGRPFEAFGMLGMIVNVGLAIVPIPYLVLLSAFAGFDRSLTEAARMSGASPRRALWTITARILAPAWMSGFALMAIWVAGSFETPIIIGLPAGIVTYMSAIYRSMATGPPDFGLAAAQSIVYVLFTSLLLGWYLFSTRRERRFAVVTGRARGLVPVAVGRWRYVLAAVVLLYFWLAFGQLVTMNAIVSLLPFYGVTEGNPLADWTFHHYATVFSGSGALGRALVGSLQIAVIVPVLAIAAALLLGYIALKTRLPGRRLAEAVGSFPVGIPGLVFAVALVNTFLGVPGLRWAYGTFVALFIAEVVVFLPFAMRTIATALMQLHGELLEASATSGAARLRTVRSIVLPMLRPAIGHAFIIVFVLSFRELGAVALLVTPNSPLYPTLTFDYWMTGAAGAVAVLNQIGVLVPAVLAVAVMAWGRETRRARPELTTVGER